MNPKQSKLQHNNQTLNFDFDEWAALYRNDPQAFEQRRQQWCKHLISSAPTGYQRRLNGLLFQIDMEKQRSSNAMDSCLKLSRLMWDSFHHMREELQSLMTTAHELQSGRKRRRVEKRDTGFDSPFTESAQIIEFATCTVAK